MSITAEKLEKWVALDVKRKALEREARQIEKERDLLSTEFEGALTAAGKDSLVRGRFRVHFVDGKPTVSWKDEFVRTQGAEAANALVQAAPVKRKIQVEETA